jgi:hypothetical protein
LRRLEPFAQVVVPDHRELDRGTLRAILRHAGVSIVISSACSPVEARPGPAKPSDPK